MLTVRHALFWAFVIACGTAVSGRAETPCVLGWSDVGGSVTEPDGAFVETMAVFDDGTGVALYVGGQFTEIGGVSVANIAKWDGRKWSAFGSGADGMVRMLRVVDTGAGPQLYIGGNFVHLDGERVNGFAVLQYGEWKPIGGGVAEFDSNVGVWSAAAFETEGVSRLYISGDFRRAGETEVRYIARWNGESWEKPMHIGDSSAMGGALRTFDFGTGPELVIGGSFQSIDKVRLANIARWDGSSPAPIGKGVDGDLRPTVMELVTFPIGGVESIVACGMMGDEVLLAWNGSEWEALANAKDDGGAERIRDAEFLETESGPKLISTGTFRQIAKPGDRLFTVNHIAMWDGEHWVGIDSGLTTDVPSDRPGRALAIWPRDNAQDTVFVGGYFDKANKLRANRIAQWGCLPLGDCDCSGGDVDFNDIDAFMIALAGPAQYATRYRNCDRRRADCNDDGSVDFNDINAFVEILIGE